MIELTTPFSEEDISKLKVGDVVSISGSIYTGRDAVLPKIIKFAEEETLDSLGIDLHGAVIFHTAVSPAGVGPTSSNKLEIESSFEPLSLEQEIVAFPELGMEAFNRLKVVKYQAIIAAAKGESIYD